MCSVCYLVGHTIFSVSDQVNVINFINITGCCWAWSQCSKAKIIPILLKKLPKDANGAIKLFCLPRRSESSGRSEEKSLVLFLMKASVSTNIYNGIITQLAHPRCAAKSVQLNTTSLFSETITITRVASRAQFASPN
jgi:hypothetical protein